MVLAPTPLLTVTVEAGGAGDEIHLHPGGQGVWVARLVASLGVDVVLCSSFGGETGTVIRSLLERWDIDVRAVSAAGGNGAYMHDRRSGERVPLAEMGAMARSRHEVDELYGVAFVAGLNADLVVLGGPETPGLTRGDVPDLVPLEVYTRMARDLRRNGTAVIADLCGPPLDAALEGGLDLLKISDEELAVTGEVKDATRPSLFEALRRLAARGAAAVVVTRGEQPTLALLEGRYYEVRGPSVDPVDQRGAGDSVTAGIAVALARGSSVQEAVRVGTAAGTLNVTRRGLASGSGREIELLVPHIEMVEVTA
ncbi:PfkB family carbohydrate kinase [Acidimicrobiia bacterium EGI L10123]|nr:PfkB family carbohydrate kinase [Acidimicrobiia bacterium EGI L10123]